MPSIFPPLRSEGPAASSPLLPGLESEFERRLRLRNAAIEQAREVARLKGAEIPRLEAAFEQQRGAVRSEAARALAAGLTAGGPVTSGAALAAGRQTGIEVGTALGGLGVEQAQALGAARQEAAAAGLEALQFEAEAGSLEEERQEKLRNLEQEIQGIKQKNTGLVTDSGEKAAREIRSLAETEEDPEVRKFLERRAAEVEAELEEVSLFGLDI